MSCLSSYSFPEVPLAYHNKNKLYTCILGMFQAQNMKVYSVGSALASKQDILIYKKSGEFRSENNK